MKLVIHSRHAALAEDFSQIVEEKIQSLERFSVLIERIEVEILHEANPRQGKHAHHIVITTHGAGPLMRAEAHSFNDLAAFDEAVKSIELQILYQRFLLIYQLSERYDQQQLMLSQVILLFYLINVILQMPEDSLLHELNVDRYIKVMFRHFVHQLNDSPIFCRKVSLPLNKN